MPKTPKQITVEFDVIKGDDRPYVYDPNTGKRGRIVVRSGYLLGGSYVNPSLTVEWERADA